MPKILVTILFFITAFNLAALDIEPWNDNSYFDCKATWDNGLNLRLDSIVRTVFADDPTTQEIDSVVATIWRNVYDSDNSELPVTSESSNGERTTYTYDANGNITFQLTEVFDEFLEEWVTAGTNEFIYDAEGILIERITFSFFEGAVIFGSRSVYAHDSEGNRISTSHFRYDLIDEIFEMNSFTCSAYDVDGNLTSTTNKTDETPTAGFNSRNEYSYDSKGHRIGWERFNFNEDIEEFEPSLRYIYVVDEDGNRLESLFEVYVDGVFIPRSNTISTYNECAQLETATRYEWDLNEEIWVLAYIDDHYYSDYGPSSIFDPAELRALVYPNPTLSKVIFDVPQEQTDVYLQITDASGSYIFQQLVSQKPIVITTSSWDNGTYFYKLSVGGEITSGKFIKL